MLVLLILISQASLTTNHQRTTKHSATKQLNCFRYFGWLFYCLYIIETNL